MTYRSRLPSSDPYLSSPSRNAGRIIKPEAGRLLTAFGIGAAIGLLFHVDTIMVGGYERLAQVSDIPPVMGFAWNVLGMGAFFVVCYLAGRLALYVQSEDRRERVRVKRAQREIAGEPISDYAHDHPESWSPERRRKALRVLAGGRRG